MQNENKILEQKKIEEEKKKEEEKNDLYFPGGYSYVDNTIYAGNQIISVSSDNLSNNISNQNSNINQKNKREIILSKENSNYIDKLTNKLPEGSKNKFMKNH